MNAPHLLDPIAITEDVIIRLVRALVTYPDNISIESRVRETSTSLTLISHVEDHGKVIGKAGATIKALQHVCDVIAARHGKSIRLTKPPTPPPPVTGDPLPPFKYDHHWSSQEVVELMAVACKALFIFPVTITPEDVGRNTFIDLGLHLTEPPVPLEDQPLGEALTRIFRVIGKNKGRSEILVAICRQKQS